MALFQVPGWSMPTAPVSTLPQSASKKRKRPAARDVDKVQSAEVNLDKLMQKLEGVRDRDDKQGPKKKKQKHGKTPQGPDSKAYEDATPSKGKGKKSSSLGGSNGHIHSAKESSRPPPQKKQKQKLKKPDVKKPSLSDQQPRNLSPAADGVSGLTSLQKGMKESLDGARFRCVPWCLRC
jgi:ribosomal RNA-processing protein 8